MNKKKSVYIFLQNAKLLVSSLQNLLMRQLRFSSFSKQSQGDCKKKTLQNQSSRHIENTRAKSAVKKIHEGKMRQQ